MSQQFCLKWNNHMNNMMDVFKNLLSTESMVDVTLACDGLSLKAHKMVLSACSPFFQSLFLENPCKHPIVILKDMKYTELKAIIEFMYHGEVNVAQEQLSALMKTAETLRVKGLAEMPNEKNSSSTQEEPSHRSVPRTETPPPSKRRRGRVRKRSLSDSNRSDDSTDHKIKQPVSPDIEELSGDVTMDNTSGQFSNLQSQVPMQSLPSHSTNSYQKASSAISQDPQIEEPASADESEFGVEPAKLLEQTLTTDDLQNRRSRQAMSSGMEMQRRPRSSTEHSSNLIPTSMSSDTSLSANQQPESPPDIKPELLELDPPMSPVAGPSHSTDNSMMMYMDQSSVSSHPGTSFQDNTALVPQDSQPQESSGSSEKDSDTDEEETVFCCSMCSFSSKAIDDICQHMTLHSDRFQYVCTVCSEAFSHHSLLKSHSCKDSVEKPHSCEICKSRFRLESLLEQHMATHYIPPRFFCGKCNVKICSEFVYTNHITAHTEEQICTCQICDKEFYNESVCDLHMRMHTNNPFKCASCPEICDSFEKFVEHSSTLEHRNDECFQACNICKNTFFYPSDLLSHIKTHDMSVQHVCKICVRVYKDKNNFKSHMTVHNNSYPYQCSVCFDVFLTDDELKSHRANHRNDYPYECPKCKAKFLRHKSLKNHKSGQCAASLQSRKKLQCHHCKRNFVRTATLRRHYREIHKDFKSCPSLYERPEHKVKKIPSNVS